MLGEGNSDWKHLSSALTYFKLKGEFTDLNVNIRQYDDKVSVGAGDLMKYCECYKFCNLKVKTICIFDRDVDKITNNAAAKGSNYKYWGNGIYSALLPIPSHRDFNEICIEQHYSDEEMIIKDDKGRRLYQSTEFDKSTGRLLKDESIICVKKNYLSAPYPRIIDDRVFNEKGENIALSKDDFASHIMNKDGILQKVSFENFRVVFEMIRENRE